jgi:hypothetical protein
MHTHPIREFGRASPRFAERTDGQQLASSTLGAVYAAFLAGVIFSVTAAPAISQVVHIDPYALDASEGSREIPDLVNGGTTALDWDHVIDVVILGDGYCQYDYNPSDPNDPNDCPCGVSGDPPIAVFTQDAYDWYYGLFGDPSDGDPPGIAPYTYFPQAFRVRAVHNRSHVCASPSRQSYYRVKMEARVDDPNTPDVNEALCGVASIDGWWNDSGIDNWTFRQRLYEAVDGLDPSVNYALYDGLDDPNELDPNSCYQVLNQDVFYPRNHLYSNLVVVMMVRAECFSGVSTVGGVSGCAPCVCRETNCQPNGASERVRVAFAEGSEHEFTHAFAYVLDEYIWARDQRAHYWNPSDPSVFRLWNVSFSNGRCDLLWPHLAPGGRYNPELHSPIGRLYMGGFCGLGVWHSEYACLMNGAGSNGGNYMCDIDSPEERHPLRDCQLCFWCQEVVAVKILEKTGQFIRAGDPSDVNALGHTWYDLWDSDLRDAYYSYFDIPTRIEDKNAYYASCRDGGDCDLGCSGNLIDMPECLVGCEIVEYGNAIYVDSADGWWGFSGSRNYPLDTIENGVARANSVCADLPLVAIKPGSYPPQTISEPAVLVAEACESVVIGE